MLACSTCPLAAHASLACVTGRGPAPFTLRAPSAAIRIASFHLDRIDLSAVDIGGGERMPVMCVLQSTIEHSVPDWVEQASAVLL